VRLLLMNPTRTLLDTIAAVLMAVMVPRPALPLATQQYRDRHRSTVSA